MFGTFHAKFRGLRHIYVQYFGKVPKPADIKLYTAFNNRECLHCHAGMRVFEEEPKHSKNPDTMSRISSNQLSCMSAHCHDTVHDVATLNTVNFLERRSVACRITATAPLIERRLRWAGFLIAAGLIVQLTTFIWIHPLAFIAFAVIACPLVRRRHPSIPVFAGVPPAILGYGGPPLAAFEVYQNAWAGIFRVYPLPSIYWNHRFTADAFQIFAE